MTGAISSRRDGHVPVLLPEVLDHLAPRDGALYCDGTFGAGGYSAALLDAARTRVVGIDRDPDVQVHADRLGQRFPGRFTFLRGRYGSMDEALAEAGLEGVDGGVVLDLGVSSMQIDIPERGFSFSQDAALDMRMERSGPTAADIVNEFSEADLGAIIRDLGEERFWRRVARAVAAARREAPIESTGQLAAIVRRVVPTAKDRIDPATRTFQALRMFVNDELGELERGLDAAERVMTDGARLVVVSFHSLEDRVVKVFLRQRSGGGARPSRHQPETAETGPQATFTLITRKPVVPGEAECQANPRARSAKLRAAVRTAAPAWAERAAA